MITDEGAIGRAQVYGGSINPLQLYIQQGAQNRAYQAAQQQRQWKQADEVIKDQRKYDIGKVWEPVYDEVNRFAQTHLRDQVFNMLSQNPGNVNAVEAMAAKLQGDVKTVASKANWLEKQYQDITKQIDGNDNLNKDYYHSKVNRMISADGRAVNTIDQIGQNFDQAGAIFDDSKGYNVNKIVTDFMKDLPKQINQHYQEMYDPLGKVYNIEETENKLGYEYQMVPGVNGKMERKIVLDPRTGLPKVSMTDDVFAQALGNRYLMNLVHDGLKESGMSETVPNQKEYLTQLLAGQNPNQIKNTIQLGFKKPESDVRHYIFGGHGYHTTPDDLEGRDKLLTRAVTSEGGGDVLSYFNNVNKDVSAKYGKDANGKRSIIITYPTYNIDQTTQEERDKMSDEQRADYYMNLYKSRKLEDKTLPITNEGERREAKIFLSKVMDEIDRKRSIGQEYITYINEKRDIASKKKGASGIAWK